jgi:hypothetical protein
LTMLQYQTSSPHCPDRTNNARTGISECGHLREFDITVTETKNLRTESYSKFEDEVDFIPHRRASSITKLFPCTRWLSAAEHIQSGIQLRGNYLHSGVASLFTLFVKMSREHCV